MKLIFTEETYDSNMFHDYRVGGVLGEYMFYKNVFIGEPGKDFRVYWNSFHKFWTLELYEIQGNKNKREHWNKAVDILKENNEIREGTGNSTWRWEGKVNIPGTKIEILPRSW